MTCAWNAYLRLLPHWMREEVDYLGKDNLQELRLRMDRPPELILGNQSIYLKRYITSEDLIYCVNCASEYSPWASSTIQNGYITANGGHRIGICGSGAIVKGDYTTITDVTSLCIRVSRDFHGIAKGLNMLSGSTLIIGCPGSGKTTLLRDLARQLANSSGSVAVVDERREVFPTASGKFCFPMASRLDVLSGYRKSMGIEMMIRTMNPCWIVVDEITAQEDCQALIYAGWCGVSILASAHAGNMNELLTRPVYKPLLQSGLFQEIIVLQPDKSWKLERVT